MNGVRFVNNYITTLSAEITNADTTIGVGDVGEVGSLGLASPGANVAGMEDNGVYLTATLVPVEGAESLADMEIIRIYGSPSAGNLTVARGMEGSTAKTWPAGTRLEARLTASGMALVVDTTNSNIQILNGPSFDTTTNVSGTGFNVQTGEVVNLNPNGWAVYGEGAVNIGTGGFGEPFDSSASTATVPNRYSINIGTGGIDNNGDNTGYGESINIGTGSAFGEKSMNFGGGGSGTQSINIGSGGAFPGVTTEGDGAINIGGQGAYSARSINIGNGGQGPFSPDAITIGAGTWAGVDGVAIGRGAGNSPTTNDATFSSCVALGADSNNTADNQAHIGDRNLELGSATSQRGIHLYSPDGTRFLLTVDNAGAVSATADPIV